MSKDKSENSKLLEMTADIVVSHLSHNRVSVEDLPGLLEAVYTAMAGCGVPEPEPVKLIPAVSVRSSVTDDVLICLECGTKCTLLKTHLTNAHNLTPAEYRARWNLGPDYPMVAAAYKTKRREMAKQWGLGRTLHLHAKQKSSSATVTVADPTDKPRARKKLSIALTAEPA